MRAAVTQLRLPTFCRAQRLKIPERLSIFGASHRDIDEVRGHGSNEMQPHRASTAEGLRAADPLRGCLAERPLPELLLSAHRTSFNGSLVLKTPAGRRAAVAFDYGAPVRAHVDEEPGSLLLNVLESQLPPEQVAFCEAHAAHQGITTFGALEQLNLLSLRTISQLFERYLMDQLRHMMQLPPLTRFRFWPGRDCFEGYDGLAQRIEPLSAATECLAESPDIERYASRLGDLRFEPIALREDGTPHDSELRGALRLIVTRLRRNPDSLENLRLCRVANPEVLIAAVYTLRVAGRTIERGHHLGRHVEPSSGVVRRFDAEPMQLSSHPAVRTSMPLSAMNARTIPQMPAVRAPDVAPVSNAPRSSAPRSSAPRSSAPRSSAPRSTALRSTHAPGSAAARVHGSVVGAGSSVAPTSAGSSLRPKLGPASSLSVSPTGSSSGQLRGISERDVEAKTLEAWMRAVDEKKHRKRALSIAEKAAALYPENPRILFYRGCLESLDGQVGPATHTLRRVLEIDPDYLEAQHELKRLQATPDTKTRLSSLFGLGRGGD